MVDYSMWQGPRARADHFRIISCITIGIGSGIGATGELGNTGVHSLDLARWGWQVDYPPRVTLRWKKYALTRMTRNARHYVATFDFGRRGIVWEGQMLRSLAVSNAPSSGSLFTDAKRDDMAIADINFGLYRMTSGA